MRVLFVHDNVFLTKNGKVYSNALPYTVLKRYLDVFSKVTVLARVREVEDIGVLPLASGDGVEFVFLESISTLRSFFGLRGQHKKYIRKLLLEHDGVIVRIPSELGLMTAQIASETSTKCLVEVVGCAWDIMWNYGGVKAKIYAPFLFRKMKNTVKKSDYVSYVTQQFLQKRYPPSKKARTMGVSDVELPNADEKTLSKRVKKIEDLREKIVFGTIANFNVHYKGIDVAFKTLSKLLHDHSDLEYHIVGSGDPVRYKVLADKLGMGNKVFFDGTLSGGKAVFDWLDGIDIYLQPSLVEGLPRSLLEAMSRGCPSIGSSVGGIPELLDKSMIFSHDNPENFSKIIYTLINDKVLMEDVAKRNFQTAKAYQKSLLEVKRKKFWIDFREDLTLR